MGIRFRSSTYPTHEYYVLQRLVDKIARFSGFIICPIYESNDRGTVSIPDAETSAKNVSMLRILHWSYYPFHGRASLHVSIGNDCQPTPFSIQPGYCNVAPLWSHLVQSAVGARFRYRQLWNVR